jgi:L-asparaginase II
MGQTPSAVAPGRPGSGRFPTDPLGRTEPGVPTGRDVEWQPLVDQRRAGVSETTVHGAVAWASGGRVIHSFGGNVLCYGRSMMKPFTARALGAGMDGTSWEQRAIALASHNGDTEHVAAALSLLSASEHGLMQTPLDVPLVQFGRQVRRPRRWYHCCSGEHAAILRAARRLGWSRVGYTLPSHPLYEAFIGVLREGLSDPSWTPLRTARDGCGLPTVSNTVAELARLFAWLAATRDRDWVWEAMVRQPDLIGGFNRLDSTILKAGGGAVVAKEGADGLLGLGIVHPDYPDGLGVVIKIAHGWNPVATWYVARATLGVLGIELRNPYPLRRQKAFLVPGVVPASRLDALRRLPTWDEWDPDDDTFLDPGPGWGHDRG